MEIKYSLDKIASAYLATDSGQRSLYQEFIKGLPPAYSPYYVLLWSHEQATAQIFPCADFDTAIFVKENLEKLLPDDMVEIREGVNNGVD